MSDDLSNPDGSIRQLIVHKPPNRHHNTVIRRCHPQHQRPPRLTYHHYPHPPQAYNVIVQQRVEHQISIDRNIPKGPHQPSVHMPPAMPTKRITAQASLSKNSLPSVFTPQVVECPIYPTKNSETATAVVPVRFIQQEQMEQQGRKEDSKEVTVESLDGDKTRYIKTLQKFIRTMSFSLKDQSEKLERSGKAENELRAAKEVIREQLLEKEEELGSSRNEMEKIKEESEKDVHQARSEENIWRNKFVELSEQYMAVLKESEEKDRNIHGLEEIVKEHGSTIDNLNGKVLSFEISVRKLKKDLEEKEKTVECLSKNVTRVKIEINELDKGREWDCSVNMFEEDLESKDEKIKMWKGKYERKCEEFSKVTRDFSKLQEANKELEIIIENLEITDLANEIAMKKSEAKFELRVEEMEGIISEKTNQICEMSDELEKVQTERDNLKLKVSVLETIISHKTDEVFAISQELEEKRKDCESNVAELKSKSKRIKELESEVESSEKEIENLRTSMFDTIVKSALNNLQLSNVSTFLENPQKILEGAANYLSSSSEKETYSEPSPSSSDKAVGGDNENPMNSTCDEAERHAVIPAAATQGKRKYSKRNTCAEKKQRKNDSSSTDHSGSQNILLSLLKIYKTQIQ